MTDSKVAIITGIGMDAKTLAHLLLSKDYSVILTFRRNSSQNLDELSSLFQDDLLKYPNARLSVLFMDITDGTSVRVGIESTLKTHGRIDEFYNLAAQSHVGDSFVNPLYTVQTNGIGVFHVLDSLRQASPKTKVYQACHDINTNVVTPAGIKSHKDIKIGDEVLTINEKTKRIERKKVVKLISYEYEGKMVEFKNRRINQLLTPNHQTLLQDNEGGISRIEAGKVQEHLPNYPASNFSLPFCLPESPKTEMINFYDFIEKNYSLNSYKNLLEEVPVVELSYLFGLYLGDGYIKKSRNFVKTSFVERQAVRDVTGKYAPTQQEAALSVKEGNFVYFCIPKKDKSRGRLEEVLGSLNIEYNSDDDGVSFSSYPFARFFELGGRGFNNKSIPPNLFDILDLKSLFEGLIGSDGYKRKNGKTYYYSTSCEKLMISILELAFRLGYYPSFSKSLDSKGCINGRQINSNVPSYIITISTKTTNKLYSKNISSVFYKNTVWCLEVEDNHNFLVERDGKVAFSGNCTSEMFGGDPTKIPFSETTSFECRSPYAIGKLLGHNWITYFRQTHGMFACSGFLFNHSNVYRHRTFFIRKVTNAAAKIALGKQTELLLGNLNHWRDEHWSDFGCEAMWKMLNAPAPDDYVIANGYAHHGEEYLDLAFGHFNLNWLDYVKFDPSYVRPNEVVKLVGNPQKAVEKLGWNPGRMQFKDHIRLMCQYDHELESGQKPKRPIVL